MLDLICDFYMEIAPQWLSETFLGRISEAASNRFKNNKIRKFVKLMFLLFFIPVSIGLALGILMLAVACLMLLNVI